MFLTEKSSHGGDVYGRGEVLDFSASLNPMGMPEAVKRALLEAADACGRYPDPYCRDLRSAVGRAEGVPAERVICGAGASELIYQYAGALTGGGPGIVVAPAFSEYAAALRAAGRGVEYLTLTESEGFRLTVDMLPMDFSGYCAVFICSPANPTGLTVEPGVVEAVAETGVRVLLDLSFLDLTERPELYGVAELTERYQNVAVLRSTTKSFAIPGARLGYLISSDAGLLRRMEGLGQCWNVSVPAQMAGTAAMGCGQWLRQSARVVASERERLFKGLSALGLRVWPGEANFLLFYSERELRGPLMERNIAIRDCSDFVGLKPGFYRVAVRTQEEDGRLLAALREVLS